MESIRSSLIKPGDNILLGNDVYGGTYRLLSKVLANLALYSADMILGSFRDCSVFEGKTGAVS